MGKGAYACVDLISRKAKKIPVCVDGVSRQSKVGYACVDDVSRQFFSGSSSISSLEVGQSVFIDVDGLDRYNNNEFMIIHKGLPSSAYDSSCDGIWVLAKYMEQHHYLWSTGATYNLNYSNSAIHKYLNSNVLSKFDTNIQSIIKEVKIPSAGSNLSTKLFLLSYDEVMGKPPYYSQTSEGVILDYFNGASAEDRKCRRSASNSSANSWWLRTQYPLNTSGAYYITNAGNSNWTSKGGSDPSEIPAIALNNECRFAMILSHDTLIDENFNVIA